jgi:hypothetical protein
MLRTAVLRSLPQGAYSASAPSIAREHREVATWLSGDYQDRTFTG